ncbi:unnamed protein product [Ilex paraguariensis]|uniref:Ras-related protein RABC2a-like n=1 Tax=Ilex paraguariensis TaxID=185542 RepID=A0ABC8UZB7_9AQUA
MGNGNYDYSFKILLIGDSGVGKSSLLLSFTSNCQDSLQDISPTIVMGNGNYDYSFKILLIGDSGVGKSSLLLSFTSNCQDSLQDISPTIAGQERFGTLTSSYYRGAHGIILGVDFKIKQLTIGGKRLKLTIWDTAGQERFGTLTSSYYRGAHGIILVYDVTRRETFTNLSEIWAKEVELYSTNHESVKILVGNKVDKDSERAVTVEEGMALAQEHKCFFLECSAKTRENVQQCFKELILKVCCSGICLPNWQLSEGQILPDALCDQPAQMVTSF